MNCIHIWFIGLAAALLIISSEVAAHSAINGDYNFANELRSLNKDLKRSLNPLAHDARLFTADLKEFLNSKESRTPSNINRIAQKGSNLLNKALDALQPYAGPAVKTAAQGYRSMQSRLSVSGIISSSISAITTVAALPVTIPKLLVQIPLYIGQCVITVGMEYFKIYFG